MHTNDKGTCTRIGKANFTHVFFCTRIDNANFTHESNKFSKI